MKKEPVLIVMSVLAALQILTAGSALTDVLGKDIAGLIVLAIAAAQTGVQFYVRGQVTPNETVAAKIDVVKSEVVAGPAAEQISDAVEGEEVNVTPVYPDDERL